jgi:2'-5' RNA ligase
MRLFAAIEISDGIKDALIEVAREFDIGRVTTVKRDAMHMTVAFLGDVDLETAKKALWEAAHGQKRFGLRISGIGFFTPTRIRVVYANVIDGAAEITGMNARLMGLVGIEDEKFSPHLTIARVKPGADVRRIRGIAEKYADMDFGGMNVTRVALIKSTLTGSGPIYEKLYEVEL